MAVTLREIMKQVQHLEMKLVAGEAGLDHEVSWTHMVDNDTISAFLQGQELTFTTGLGLNENLNLLRLVKEVWRNKASGIVYFPPVKELDIPCFTGMQRKNLPGNRENFPDVKRAAVTIRN